MLIFCWLFFGLFVLALEITIALVVPAPILFSLPLRPFRPQLRHLMFAIALIALDLGLLGPLNILPRGMSRDAAFVGDACFVMAIFAVRLYLHVSVIGWLTLAYAIAIASMIVLVNVGPMVG